MWPGMYNDGTAGRIRVSPSTRFQRPASGWVGNFRSRNSWAVAFRRSGCVVRSTALYRDRVSGRAETRGTARHFSCECCDAGVIRMRCCVDDKIDSRAAERQPWSDQENSTSGSAFFFFHGVKLARCLGSTGPLRFDLRWSFWGRASSEFGAKANGFSSSGRRFVLPESFGDTPNMAPPSSRSCRRQITKLRLSPNCCCEICRPIPHALTQAHGPT